MSAETYRSISDLPASIPVFPLAGALLLPRWTLPLNIFEPRYLNMIDDAMSGHRMIGMIQSVGGDRAAPNLAAVGCAGRITSYSETEDGRYMISLSGICRYRVAEELDIKSPYRQVTPDWSPFAHDLTTPTENGLPDRSYLVASLKRYTQVNAMEVDWDAVENAQLETLINALCAGCPFGTMEKQALLEAGSVEDRAQVLITLLDMDVAGDDKTTLQ